MCLFLPATTVTNRYVVHKFPPNFHLRLERSTDQVIKPINLEALSKWVGQIPADVVKDMADVAPMLATLGYDPMGNPPDYGKPDAFVQSKMRELEKNRGTWEEKEREMLRERESIRNSLLKQRDAIKEEAEKEQRPKETASAARPAQEVLDKPAEQAVAS